MAEPLTFQEQQETTSTVTVVETDEQVCKHSHYAIISFSLIMFRSLKCVLTECMAKRGRISLLRSFHSSEFPLDGVRIIDLTRIVAGPYCTMILGDLGAEVLKVEIPGVGDEARKWGPPFVGDTFETCYFIPLNRNKKSICVNLKSRQGKDILYNLAKKSDILVENFVPGKLDELKLGYEHFKEVAPHLIYCSITGYGLEGPYKNKPGYDVIAASVGGLLHITGPEGGEPIKVGVAVTDLATGLYAHGAIMAALIKRSKTGKGQKIDCNLLSTQVASLINIGSNYLNAGQEATRMGTAHPSIVPYQSFPTKDGYFTIGTGSDLQFAELCKKIGHSDLAKNSKYLTNKNRVENRDELITFLCSILKTKTNKEWNAIFEGSSFPCGPVNNLKEVFDDPHIKAIELIKTVHHQIAGDIKVVGPPVKYSEGGNSVRMPPPTLGQHTDEVLREVLNFTQEEIENLRKNKVIQ